MDLLRPARTSPGHRYRRRRAQAVPVSPALARASRPPKFEQDGRVRRSRCRSCAGASWPSSRVDEPTRRARARLRRAAARRWSVPDRQRGVRRRRGRHWAGDGPQGPRDASSTTRSCSTIWRRAGPIASRRFVDPARPEAAERAEAPTRRGRELLAYREGRRWHDVRSEDINEYLKEQLGEDFSAKDFRTWNASVLAAVSLADRRARRRTKTGRKRASTGRSRRVAQLFGNTPAVARRAYIDPRVFDRYLSGWTIGPCSTRSARLENPTTGVRARIERAVVDLLDRQPRLAGARRTMWAYRLVCAIRQASRLRDIRKRERLGEDGPCTGRKCRLSPA